MLAAALGLTAVISLGSATAQDSTPQTGATDLQVVDYAGIQNATSDALSRSQDLLLKARLSLMSRDVVSAERFVQEAQNLSVT
ncbi:MAG: hypothetical protein IKW74_03265, partial [Thermoguttaceae bacterium]|nr:hypothetical protein [Thermoguttaceae bacterium]